MKREQHVAAGMMRMAVLLGGIVVTSLVPMSANAGEVCEDVPDGYNKYGGVMFRKVCSYRADPVPTPSPGSQDTGSRFGAIAVTESIGGYFGYSWAWNSKAQAESVALANCDKRAGRKGACRIATWFSNRCGALAMGPDGIWNADDATSKRDASAKALNDCNKRAGPGKCTVEVSVCSG